MVDETNALRQRGVFKDEEEDDEGMLTLDDCKMQIVRNLLILEKQGMVSRKNDFQVKITIYVTWSYCRLLRCASLQDILVAVAGDVITIKKYRTQRRREYYRWAFSGFILMAYKIR